tara:strand:- start:3907 stop:4230 length:324 start_codon:yes stop_codon:yes gene_type:complete
MIETKFSIGQLVKHKFLPFRGVIYDVDPMFNNTEEWYQSIPKDFRPKKNQPFYHLFAENGQIFYNAYVSEQNLLIDESNLKSNHPDVDIFFNVFDGEKYHQSKAKIN